MATMALSAVGTAVGSNFGFLGATIGSQLGAAAGGFIDDAIFGVPTRSSQGPRLSDLSVQTSTYGRMIPIAYGSVRVAGNIIWSRPIKENATTTTSSGGGKGGGGVRTERTEYSYSVSAAIAICEGKIDEVVRVWADAKLLNLGQGNFRIYKGSETQLPDSLIESFEGSGSTPAYRGLAYMVIEDFPLADFGNRIPNFTFEVKRTAAPTDINGEAIEQMITGVTMIPGGGEFAYDTQLAYKVPGAPTGPIYFTPTGTRTIQNSHNHLGIANAKLAVDQLEEALPNCEWVSVVVTWFGTSLDAGSCTIHPGVEFNTGATTEPESWEVAGLSRSSAYLISRDSEGNPVYGGTPDDDSLVRLFAELQSRGFKTMLLPMIFMDTPGKPWRGRITGSANDVYNFFIKTNGYNAFINHYASLLKNHLDAFAIGSELVGVTSVMSATAGDFPAVNALVSLAASVKSTLGSGVKLTYAADWSEYHHEANGWYHLDPLWASANIDMVGIDAYFPLTDAPQDGYDTQAIQDGWTSGEGYDWYYTDAARTTKASLAPAYAWKNLDWWWKNSHTNPDSSTSAWVPQSKPIWFTEYGFPSVDGATNQPNVFYAPDSSEGQLPRFSRGRVDFRIQRLAIAATEKQWENSPMIEQMFVWTWDARPFPYWPDLEEVWGDGNLWKFGHWINGKVGASGLGSMVHALIERVGVATGDADISRLNDLVDGFVLTRQMRVREAIELLQKAYFFDMIESEGQLKCIPRGNGVQAVISSEELVPVNGKILRITRGQEVELPQNVSVVYFNRTSDYQPGTQYSQRETVGHRESQSIDLPIVMTDAYARTIADISLYTAWVGRTHYRCTLPVAYAALEPGDVIEITNNSITHKMRITRNWYGAPGLLEIDAIAEDISVYDFSDSEGEGGITSQTGNLPVETEAALLDLPALPGNPASSARMHIAAKGRDNGWQGMVLYRSDDGGANYLAVTNVSGTSTMGRAMTALADTSDSTRVDEANSVDVAIAGPETLATAASDLALLNGANTAVLGDEILQFREATLLADGQYRLRGLLRGRLGTDWAMGNHAAGDRFVLLNGAPAYIEMPDNLFGLPREYKAVSVGDTLGNTGSLDFNYSARALKPLSPVHIGGTRDGSGNLSISWKRRTRGGGQWRDGADAPLNETNERYDVDILDGSVVVRTISNIPSPTTIYTAANQTTDFGSIQSSITCRIFQLSDMVGRGDGRTAIL